MRSARDFDRFVIGIELGAEPTPALKLAVDTYKMDAADASNGSWCTYASKLLSWI
jgi:hypothetical protein